MCLLRGLYLDGALREPRNARQNLIGGLGPHEGLGIRLMRLDECLNRGLQLGHTVMRPATQLFVGQFREPTLHQTQPRPLGGREMNVKPRALGEPVADERRLVCALVIHNDVNI
jgi:hypothetical protein